MHLTELLSFVQWLVPTSLDTTLRNPEGEEAYFQSYAKKCGLQDCWNCRICLGFSSLSFLRGVSGRGIPFSL